MCKMLSISHTDFTELGTHYVGKYEQFCESL